LDANTGLFVGRDAGIASLRRQKTNQRRRVGAVGRIRILGTVNFAQAVIPALNGILANYAIVNRRSHIPHGDRHCE
jgi:hypothetical protein